METFFITGFPNYTTLRRRDTRGKAPAVPRTKLFNPDKGFFRQWFGDDIGVEG
jgi:hypothetical protein